MENYSLYSPYKYMEGKQPEFNKTIIGHGYNEVKAVVLFDFIIDTIKLLEGCRVSRSITEDTLEKQKLKLQPPEWRFVELYLMQCLSCNSTYKYSYNLLAQAHWHETGIPLPINEFTPLDILNLIDIEAQGNIEEDNVNIEGLTSICSEDDLKFIFGKLVLINKLHPKEETNFVKCLQGGLLSDWKPTHWIGSNPELATLIYTLTGNHPTPSIINRLFVPSTEYDSQSTKRIYNKKIIKLITAALK